MLKLTSTVETLQLSMARTAGNVSYALSQVNKLTQLSPSARLTKKAKQAEKESAELDKELRKAVRKSPAAVMARRRGREAAKRQLERDGVAEGFSDEEDEACRKTPRWSEIMEEEEEKEANEAEVAAADELQMQFDEAEGEEEEEDPDPPKRRSVRVRRAVSFEAEGEQA